MELDKKNSKNSDGIQSNRRKCIAGRDRYATKFQKGSSERRHIEPAVVKYTKSKGGMSFKFSAGGGVPDRLCFMPGGILIMVETKSKGKALDPLQAAMKRKFEALGFRVEVANTLEKVKDIFNEI